MDTAASANVGEPFSINDQSDKCPTGCEVDFSRAMGRGSQLEARSWKLQLGKPLPAPATAPQLPREWTTHAARQTARVQDYPLAQKQSRRPARATCPCAA